LSFSPGRGFLLVCDTEKPKESGNSSVSRFIRVDLPLPEGPQRTNGLAHPPPPLQSPLAATAMVILVFGEEDVSAWPKKPNKWALDERTAVFPGSHVFRCYSWSPSTLLSYVQFSSVTRKEYSNRVATGFFDSFTCLNPLSLPCSSLQTLTPPLQIFIHNPHYKWDESSVRVRTVSTLETATQSLVMHNYICNTLFTSKT